MPLYSSRQYQTWDKNMVKAKAGPVCAQLEPFALNEMKVEAKLPPKLNEEQYAELKAYVLDGKPYVLRMCIACHGSGADYKIAPPIPFDDEAQLARALLVRDGSGTTLLERIKYRVKWDQDERIRMPRGLPPLKQEVREQLTTYFENLAGVKK